MGLLKNAAASSSPASSSAEPAARFDGFEFGYGNNHYTKARQVVNADTAKTIATAYRAKNILGDDIAKIPIQQFRRNASGVTQIAPDPRTRNISYLLEIQPNRWMSPFIFKKTIVEWLIFWGNSYIWNPPGNTAELFILPSSTVRPFLDAQGGKVYDVTFPNGKKDVLPDVEVLHLMINSTNGRIGKSVLEFAAETFGKQLAAYETQNLVQGDGVKAAVIMQMTGSLSKEDRETVRESYKKALAEPGGIAVIDNKVAKVDQVGMKLTDAQFLESINATDRDIANFFGIPEYKLNMGKQSYESNMAQKQDYLETTLDPYLVQWEQAARIKWLAQNEQMTNYFKWNRESFLRTDAKSRAELFELRIRNGTMSPNQAKNIEDENGYEGGDEYWMTRNNATIKELLNAQPIPAN